MSDLNLFGPDMLQQVENTGDIVSDICKIIDGTQKQAYRAVDTILIMRNWMIGKRIAEEELHGNDRADYGVRVIKELSRELKSIYGKGYDRSNLYHCLNFYKTYPEIVDTVNRQSAIRLSWSHYRILMRVSDSEARAWYENEAFTQTWSVRTLKRNVETQYYYRLLQSQIKEPV